MEIVGIRRLKQNLSAYLSKVKSGEQVIVTRRNKEIAVISPWAEEEKDLGVVSLIQKGRAKWGGGKPAGLPSRIAARGGAISTAVVEGRR